MLFRRAGLTFDDLGLLDDIALRTFLDPCDGGVDPERLGVAAIGCTADLAERIAGSLPEDAALIFRGAVASSPSPAAVRRARSRVLEQLAWPLIYSTRPEDYDDLTLSEHIATRVIDELDIDARVVCDIGAGTGRFTLVAAERAQRVIAVDAVPALLQRLGDRARRAGLENIETRRGSFCALPLADGSVDLAVACSSFMTTGPHGGLRALREAERVVRRGGEVAIIWAPHPEWFMQHHYEHIVVRGRQTHGFRDVATAERLCATYYSEAAAAWVRKHQTSDVPYSVLGVSPPHDLCIKRLP